MGNSREREHEEDGEEGEDDVAQCDDPAVPEETVAVLVVSRVAGDDAGAQLEREDDMSRCLQPCRGLGQNVPVWPHQPQEAWWPRLLHAGPDDESDEQPVHQRHRQQADLADTPHTPRHQDVGQQGEAGEGGHVVGDDVLDVLQGGDAVVGVVVDGDALVVDDGDQAVAAPHGHAQVCHHPEAGHQAQRDSQPREERAEVAVEATHGECGVLAQQHLQQQERQAQHDHQAEVHQEEDDTAVSDDGLREVQQGVQGQREGPGGGQGVRAPGPLAVVHLRSGVGLLGGRRGDVEVGLRPPGHAQGPGALHNTLSAWL